MEWLELNDNLIFFRHRWTYAEGNHSIGSTNNEDQDHCSTREKVLRLDWWLHPGFSLHLPTDVDLQAGIRWIWSIYCSQKMLLRFQFTVYVVKIYLFIIKWISNQTFVIFNVCCFMRSRDNSNISINSMISNRSFLYIKYIGVFRKMSDLTDLSDTC